MFYSPFQKHQATPNPKENLEKSIPDSKIVSATEQKSEDVNFKYLEGFVTKTHSSQNPKGVNEFYFEVSNFNDPTKAGAERVVYRIVFEPSPSSSSQMVSSSENILPVHFGDRVVYKGKVPFSPDDRAITKGKILEWNQIHPKSKPFFIACSSVEFVRNHIRNVFKDATDKTIDEIIQAFGKASKEQNLKTISAYLTFCSCTYVYLRENEDVSPNINSMISKERFNKTVETEKEKRAAIQEKNKLASKGSSARGMVRNKGSSARSGASLSKSLIFSGMNPYDDLSSLKKIQMSASSLSEKASPPSSKAAEFIISIVESNHFKQSGRSEGRRGLYILTPRQLELVFVTWNKDNCLRPFYLLGLSKKEIKECSKNIFLRKPPSLEASSSQKQNHNPQLKTKMASVEEMSSSYDRECRKCKECSGLSVGGTNGKEFVDDDTTGSDELAKSSFPWCGFCCEKPILFSSGGTFDYEDLINLYEKIVECPFAFKSIPMKKALEIFHSHRSSSVSRVPAGHLFCGHFIRKLDGEKNSTCDEVTGSSFEESFNQYEKLLRCVYGVLSYTRSNGRKFAYLYVRFKVEEKIAKFISDCVVHSEQVESHRRRYLSQHARESSEDEEDTVFGEQDDGEGVILTKEQRGAVDVVVSSSGCPFPCIVTVTGGPGVGKTTILKEVIRRFKKDKIKYRVSSFTGKAVSRIKEKTRCRARFASTLDRLIAKNDVFDFEHLIIDEASMVTSQLIYRFLMARKAASASSSLPQRPLKLTFVGDPDQLPPIDWGNIFSILLHLPSDWIPRYDLSVGFRLLVNPKGGGGGHDEDGGCGSSQIQKSFEAIRNSSVEDFKRIIFKTSSTDSSSSSASTLLLIQNSKEKGYEDVVERVKQIRKDYGDSEPSKFGIFSPFNQAVSIFNSLIRDIFIGEEEKDSDSSQQQKTLPSSTTGASVVKFVIGDRVIMTKNIYFPDEESSPSPSSEDDEDLGCGGVATVDTFSTLETYSKGGGFAYMNGDTGVVVEQNESGIFVDFDTGHKNVFFQWETPSQKVLNEKSEASPDLKLKAFEEDLKSIISKTGESVTFSMNEFTIHHGGGGEEDDFVDGGSRGALPLSEKTLYADLLKLAFSLTVHKSQGSEYDHVIVHIPRNFSQFSSLSEGRSFINRNLLYTAMTRARKTVTIVTPGTFEREIASAILSKPPERFGNLGHRIVDCLFERDFHHLIIAKDDEEV